MENRIADRPIRAAAEAHVALALVLDVSGSMYGDSINLLNRAVNQMISQMKNDGRLKNVIDLAIFIFGKHGRENIYQGFRAISDCDSINLEATDDNTYVVAALDKALGIIQKRCSVYDRAGGAYKPWIVLITDGEFHDADAALNQIGQRMKERQAQNKLQFFGLGIDNFQRTQLEKFTNNPQQVIAAQAANFNEFFSWIGKSMKTVSTSAVGAPVALQPLSFTV